MAGSCKNTQKTSLIYSNKNTRKDFNLILHRFFDENNVSFTPSHSFFKGKDKVPKNLGRGRNFLRISVAETKMEYDFFILIFALLALMIIDSAFRI